MAKNKSSAPKGTGGSLPTPSKSSTKAVKGGSPITQMELERARTINAQLDRERLTKEVTRNTDASRRAGYIEDQMEIKDRNKQLRQEAKANTVTTARQLTFDKNGAPANAYTQRMVDRATFIKGKPFGAEASQLVKAGYDPSTSTAYSGDYYIWDKVLNKWTQALAPPKGWQPGDTPQPNANFDPPPGVTVPTVPVPAVSPVVVSSPTPTPTPVVADPTIPTTYVSDPVAAAKRTNGFNSFAKPAAAPRVAVPTADTGSFASGLAAANRVANKGSNKQSLDGLGARVDFGSGFGNYAKKRDGSF